MRGVPKASRRSFAAFLAVSLVLHLLVCKIPVQSMKLHDDVQPEILHVAIVSVAAPSVVSSNVDEKKTNDTQEKPQEVVKKEETEKPVQKKELAKIEPAAGKMPDMPKSESMQKAEIQKPTDTQNSLVVETKTKSNPTSNDVGNSASTIKTLAETDYIQTVAPVYPRRAVDRGIQGTVIIKLLISQGGVAKDLDIATSSGYEMLDRSALDAVSQWRFKTASLNTTQEIWVQVPVKFMIQ